MTEIDYAKLLEALEEYGDHDHYCRIWDNLDCTCGYEKIIKEAKEQLK